MAPVAGGVDQHVGAAGGHAAVERRFERLVAALAVLEAQVVAKNQEALAALGHQRHQVGQVAQVGFIDFDQAQALGRKGV